MTATDKTQPTPASLDRSDRVLLTDGRVLLTDGKVDEVFGSRFAHLERMDARTWFLLVGHDDGTETALRIDGDCTLVELRPARKEG